MVFISPLCIALSSLFLSVLSLFRIYYSLSCTQKTPVTHDQLYCTLRLNKLSKSLISFRFLGPKDLLRCKLGRSWNPKHNSSNLFCMRQNIFHLIFSFLQFFYSGPLLLKRFLYSLDLSHAYL